MAHMGVALVTARAPIGTSDSLTVGRLAHCATLRELTSLVCGESDDPPGVTGRLSRVRSESETGPGHGPAGRVSAFRGSGPVGILDSHA
jgi:hypothetical protein